jgi:hypothetical protein
MVRLFEKARRLHEPGTESYGKALLLQVWLIFLLTQTYLTSSARIAAVPNDHRIQPTYPPVRIIYKFRSPTSWSWERETTSQSRWRGRTKCDNASCPYKRPYVCWRGPLQRVEAENRWLGAPGKSRWPQQAHHRPGVQMLVIWRDVSWSKFLRLSFPEVMSLIGRGSRT